MTLLGRRDFLGRVAATSAWTIVPRRVLGGRGYVPPSDMVVLAQVGCGTQALRQVNTGMVRRADLQFGLEKGRAIFEEEILRRHRELRTRLSIYILKARPMVVLTAPVI